MKGGVDIMTDCNSVTFEEETLTIPEGNFIAPSTNIERFMEEGIKNSHFVLSLYTPLYKQRSRLCGGQDFYQATNNQSVITKESGVHFEIRFIRDRQNTSYENSKKEFHYGILINGSADTSVPEIFQQYL